MDILNVHYPSLITEDEAVLASNRVGEVAQQATEILLASDPSVILSEFHDQETGQVVDMHGNAQIRSVATELDMFNDYFCKLVKSSLILHCLSPPFLKISTRERMVRGEC